MDYTINQIFHVIFYWDEHAIPTLVREKWKKKVDLKILQWYECRYEADGQ